MTIACHRKLSPIAMMSIAGLILSISTAAANFPLLLIDEDCLDNGAKAIEELAMENTCGSGNPATCVNDQLANPGVRTVLDIPPGTIIGSGHPNGTTEKLWTGQEFDEAFYLVPTILPTWVNAGPTTDGAYNYLLAVSPGFGNNGEFLLDKIPNVTPLRTAGLQALVGESFCAVVYDSDISMNYSPIEGNLQGATLGIIAIKVLAVGPDPSGSVLPDITIEVLGPGKCLEGVTPVQSTTWGHIKARHGSTLK